MTSLVVFFSKITGVLLGGDIVKAMKEFFRSGIMLREINVTTITLIHRTKSSTVVGYHKPIACYSLLYKIITKLICTRLSSVLPDVVSQNQGAFINGRNIISNILLF